MYKTIRISALLTVLIVLLLFMERDPDSGHFAWTELVVCTADAAESSRLAPRGAEQIAGVAIIPFRPNERPSGPSNISITGVMTIRCQLELYQIQHHGQFPDLVGRGWEQLTHKTDQYGRINPNGDYGPYLQQPAVNTLTYSSKVVDQLSEVSGNVGWYYKPGTTEIFIVMSAEESKNHFLDYAVRY